MYHYMSIHRIFTIVTTLMYIRELEVLKRINYYDLITTKFFSQLLRTFRYTEIVYTCAFNRIEFIVLRKHEVIILSEYLKNA